MTNNLTPDQVQQVAEAMARFRTTMVSVARATIGAVEEWWESIDPDLREVLEAMAHSNPKKVQCVVACLCPREICLYPVEVTAADSEEREYVCSCEEVRT